MANLLEQIKQAAAQCDCGGHHPIDVAFISITQGALEQIAPFLQDRSYTKAILVADDFTYEAAGKQLSAYLSQSDIDFNVCLLKTNPQGDVVADEASLVQVMLATPPDADVLLAVGSGTIHDIVRFVSYKMRKPFLSVPTAASVDGFTSAGAPLLIRGFKTTIQTCSPLAVFADPDILAAAPKQLTAAGFGDMIGKFTSLADWQVSRLLADEPFCKAAEKITKQALDACIANLDEIAAGKTAGVQTLMEALIQSGLAMLLADHSRSASGAEHHLSHYWEMEFLQRGKRQILHGAKVGVASTVISALYRQLAEEKPLDALPAAHRSHLQNLFRSIPAPAAISTWLQTAGGPSTPQELGIDDELLKRSLREAHTLRDRHTGLCFLNENGFDPAILLKL